MKERSLQGTSVALMTVLAPIAWGTTYIVVTEFLPDDRPLFVAAGRVVPAGLVLVVIGVLGRRPDPRSWNWSQLAMLALFNFGIFFPLLIVAIYRLPGGVAASMGGLQPLLVALGGYVLVGIEPKRRDLAIGAIAAVGVAMVVIRPGAEIDPVGVVAAIGANVSFSVGVVLTKRFAVSEDRLTRTGIQLLLSGIVIVPVAVLVEGQPPRMSLDNVAGLGYLSLAATGAAFVIWFNGIPQLPSQAPPVLGLAAPITGAALGWIILDEALSAIQLAGFAVTIGAIIYTATIGSTEAPRHRCERSHPHQMPDTPSTARPDAIVGSRFDVRTACVSHVRDRGVEELAALLIADSSSPRWGKPLTSRIPVGGRRLDDATRRRGVGHPDGSSEEGWSLALYQQRRHLTQQPHEHQLEDSLDRRSNLRRRDDVTRSAATAVTRSGRRRARSVGH